MGEEELESNCINYVGDLFKKKKKKSLTFWDILNVPVLHLFFLEMVSDQLSV